MIIEVEFRSSSWSDWSLTSALVSFMAPRLGNWIRVHSGRPQNARDPHRDRKPLSEISNIIRADALLWKIEIAGLGSKDELLSALLHIATHTARQQPETDQRTFLARPAERSTIEARVRMRLETR